MNSGFCWMSLWSLSLAILIPQGYGIFYAQTKGSDFPRIGRRSQSFSEGPDDVAEPGIDLEYDNLALKGQPQGQLSYDENPDFYGTFPDGRIPEDQGLAYEVPQALASRQEDGSTSGEFPKGSLSGRGQDSMARYPLETSRTFRDLESPSVATRRLGNNHGTRPWPSRDTRADSGSEGQVTAGEMRRYVQGYLRLLGRRNWEKPKRASSREMPHMLMEQLQRYLD